MIVTINGERTTSPHVQAVATLWEHIARLEDAEVWFSVKDGPALCLLKGGRYMFLAYLPSAGAPGYRTVGNADRSGSFRVPLSNGQVDEYALAWCVEAAAAYEAVLYFLLNEGKRTPDVEWQDA